MEQLKVNNAVISKQGKTSYNYEKFIEIANKKHINILEVEIGNRLKIDKYTYFDFLWPNNSEIINENILNNNSIVCKLYYKNFSILFTGDIEKIAEEQLIETYKNNLKILKSTILKVPHHGSKSSSTQEFLQEIKPEIALIGVGEKNKFGHPNNQVLERLQNLRYNFFSHR